MKSRLSLHLPEGRLRLIAPARHQHHPVGLPAEPAVRPFRRPSAVPLGLASALMAALTAALTFVLASAPIPAHAQVQLQVQPAQAQASQVQAPQVQAQDYPNRPVKILVGAPPGGSTDIIARLMAQKLSERFGKSFLVENRAGANMIIASEAAARATADGYTLIMVPSNHVINGGLYSKLPYDPIRDFAPVGRLANLPLMLVVHPSLPVKSLADLVTYAKEKNGDLAYSSSGIGSPHHLGMELIIYTAKLQMTHVPFKGASDALLDTLAGRTPVGIVTVPPALPHVKAGKLRAIASAGSNRVEVLPDVPTIAESGMPGFRLDVWLGLLAPAATPKGIVALLNAELLRIVNAEDVKEQLRAQGFEPSPSSPEEFSAVMEQDLARYKEIARLSGAKLD